LGLPCLLLFLRNQRNGVANGIRGAAVTGSSIGNKKQYCSL
jgi:hypothetical protein